MRLRNLFFVSVAALAVSACSNDGTLENPTDNGLNFQGEGEMSISLKFAGAVATRAVDDFEYGTDTESKINNAEVFYFKAAEQGTGYTYLGTSGQVTVFHEVQGTGNNVEKEINAEVPATVVKHLQENTNQSAFVVVVLNKVSGFPANLAANSSTYADFNKAFSFADNAGFMMTSVNFSETVAQGETSVLPLTKINHENIRKQGDVSGNAPKTVEVYVERICGKVTLSTENLNTALTPSGVTATIKGWGLNVRNTVAYPVKELGTFTTLSSTDWPGAALWNSEANHRSFWAKDPNYATADNYVNVNTTGTPFKKIQVSELVAKFGTANPQYCLENTMDYGHQYRNESTSAIIYAQYLPSIQEEGETTATKMTGTWVIAGGQYYSLKTYINNFLRQQNVYVVKETDEATQNVTFTSATYDPNEENSDVKFSFDAVTVTSEGESATTTAVGGKNYKLDFVEGTSLYQGTDLNKESQPLDDDGLETLNDAFTSYISNTTVYVNGYCYYEIPIRQFTDTELNNQVLGDDWNGTYLQIHLGRYGVVRNHHYQLDVTSITEPGKPIKDNTITPDDGDPDDETVKYGMRVSIKVLAWAVRNQDVNL